LRESKRGGAYLLQLVKRRVKEGAKPPLKKKSSPSPYQGEGDKGDRVLKIRRLRCGCL